MTNTDITSILTGQTNMKYLLDTYMSIEEKPRTELENQVSDLDNKSQVLSDLDSKLTALRDNAERLSDPLTNYFQAKTATSSDTDKFTVEAANSSSLGNHSLLVSRLAQNDTRVSKQFDDTATDFSSITADQTFTIQVGSPTDEDSSNRVDISVTVAASVFTQDNEHVLYDIASAINDAMSASVTDESIESDEVSRATVVKEIDGISRLQLRSNQSGYTYRMSFADSADSLLGQLEVADNRAQNGTRGGYMVDVGTDKETSDLNSQFTLDGLTFYRDSNSVSDAVEGVTVQFLKAFDTQENITVNPDTEAVTSEVNNFIKSYNDALKFLEDNAQIDTQTYQQGVLSTDTTYRGMKNEIRSMVLASVPGVTNAAYSYLHSIGIEADNNGYLSLSDSDKFSTALENNASYVSDIFRQDDNGLAVKLDSYLTNYVKAAGTISNSKQLIDDRISVLNDRISTMNDYLDRRREQLQKQFEDLQQAMAYLSSQQSSLTQFMSKM